MVTTPAQNPCHLIFLAKATETFLSPFPEEQWPVCVHSVEDSVAVRLSWDYQIETGSSIVST